MPSPHPYTAKDGQITWRVRFRLAGRHLSETFGTEPEAAQFCRQVEVLGASRALAELDAEHHHAVGPSLDAWAERHFASMTSVTPGTLTTYRRIYRRVWSPLLGPRALSDIDREGVSKALRLVPGSDKTVKNAWGVLATMFKVAVADGLLTKSPCAGIKLAIRTSHERAEMRFLTHGEFWQLLDQTPAHWQPLVLTLAGTGMRWGEAAALTVGDVDLSDMVVHITKAEKWDPSTSARTVGPPKSKRSRRTVTLPNEVVDALRPLVEGRARTDRLFLPPKGGALRHMTFYRDIWCRKCTVGLEPRPRIHDLRHSHVAWLIAANRPLPVIQARLGHEKITTTIDTYGHLIPDLQRAAAEAASMVLGQRPSPPAKELPPPTA